MENYIAFFDLLGIKAIASYNKELYFENINSFQCALKLCSKHLIETRYQIRAFSDCAYIECNNITKLFDFFNDLRSTLFLKHIFFNAAITQGTLSSPPPKNDNAYICISFNSPDTVKVFSMQTSFSGIGIYIDPALYKNLNKDIQNKYVIKSAYCIYEKDELYNKYESYYDLKYQHISPTLAKYLLMNYIETIALNKKASRYYLSALITCFNQLSYKELTTHYIDLFLNVNFLSTNKIIFYDLLPIHLMLINRLYNSYYDIPENKHNSPNYDISDKIDNIINHSALKEGFDNLLLYSDKLISKKNKYLLANYMSMKMLEDTTNSVLL